MSKKPFIKIAPTDVKDDLSPTEIYFYKLIESLDKDKGCYASNQYFVDYFKGNISVPTVTRTINKLKAKGYISVQYLNHNTQRVIRIKSKVAYTADEQAKGVINYVNALFSQEYEGKPLSPNDPKLISGTIKRIKEFGSSDNLIKHIVSERDYITGTDEVALWLKGEYSTLGDDLDNLPF